MTVAAPSSRTFRRIAPPGRCTLNGHVAVPQPLATAFQDATGLTSLYVRACLAFWNWLVVLRIRLLVHLERGLLFVRRLRLAIRLGAATAVQAMQTTDTRSMPKASNIGRSQASESLSFTRVSMPDTTDISRDWGDVMRTSLYPGDGPVRAAIYRRVSTLEQEEEGHSLDEQLARGKRYVEDSGWVLVEVYSDVYSGKSGKRKALRRLEKAVIGGEVDVVVIDRIDRLYRNLLGLLRMVKLLNEYGVALVSVSERVGFDTPWGRLVLNVLGALAEYYLVALSADTSKGKHGRARLGLANGAFRLGVCNGLCSECIDTNGRGYCPFYGRDNRGNGRVPVHHPIEAEAVQLMYRWYSTGSMSYENIAHCLNARQCNLPDGTRADFRTKGIPGRSEPGPFTDDAVRYILKNPFYKGTIGYGGVKPNGKKERKPVEFFDGQHEPLVDEEIWNRCQEVRKLRRHRPHSAVSPARVYPLSRLLFCNRCKGSMRGFSSNGGQSRYYGDHLFREKWRGERKKGKEDEELSANLGLAYNHQPNVVAEVAEEQVQAVLRQVRLPTEWKRLILAYVSEEGGLTAIQRKKLEVRERLQRAHERYLSPVAPISRWDLERIERECMAELERLDRMLPPGTEERDVWQYLDGFGILWEAATWEEQNGLMGQLCSAIFVHDQQVVNLVAYPAFHDLLAEAAGRASQMQEEFKTKSLRGGDE
jgi:DNA invertase Pin-like site-specific DNA recombinase